MNYLFTYLNFTWVSVAFSYTSHWLTHVRCEVALCSTAHYCVHYARADIIYIPWLFYMIQCQKVPVITLTSVPTVKRRFAQTSYTDCSLNNKYIYKLCSIFSGPSVIWFQTSLLQNQFCSTSRSEGPWPRLNLHTNVLPAVWPSRLKQVPSCPCDLW